MNQQEAEQLLEDAAELLPLATGALAYVKELRDRCLDAGIPAGLARPPGKGKS